MHWAWPSAALEVNFWGHGALLRSARPVLFGESLCFLFLFSLFHLRPFLGWFHVSVSWLDRQPLQVHCQRHLPGHPVSRLPAPGLLAVPGLHSASAFTRSQRAAPSACPSWVADGDRRGTCESDLSEGSEKRPSSAHKPLSTCPRVHTRPPTGTICHWGSPGSRKGLPGCSGKSR